LRVVNRYLTKRGRTYYLTKRIPADVSELHPGEDTIRESLNTTDLLAARRIRDARLKELEAKWNAYRALPRGKHLAPSELHEALELRKEALGPDRAEALDLVGDRALDIYNADVPEELHGEERSEKAGEFYAIASGSKMPTRMAVDAFLAGANLKPSTRGLYKGLLNQLAEEFAFVEDMGEAAVRNFVRSYASTHTAKATGNLLTASRGLLHFHGYKRDAFRDLRIDAGKAAVKKGVFTDTELTRLAYTNSALQWVRDCIIVAAYSGLRRQEVCGVVYDADKDQLVVTKAVAKTANSIRRVPCHPKAREAAKRLATGTANKGKLTRRFHELVDRLEIDRVVSIDGVEYKRDFHALRHTFASKLTALGVEQAARSSILGHGPANVTGRYDGKAPLEIYRPVIDRVRYDEGKE
jgi:integrase